ncbi:MAG: purine-nucleoside phosphorylase [Firmicutes bacterium]|nr:purine-nucleoside phosphorylase [Bacillota bacterium]
MTPHIEAKKEDIAKIVLMPGDSLRAEMIAKEFLENPRLVNKLRNNLTYTGTYKGKEVTVMASGMGMPSMGIYSYELFKFYDVDSIIRLGTAGAYTKDLNLYDVLLVNAVYSDSSYAKVQNGSEESLITGSSNLNFYLQQAASNLNIPITIANIYCTDVFYKEKQNFKEIYNKHGCLAQEMESFSLFHNAQVLNKKAACLLTISDNMETHEETTPLERQESFKKMVEIALESIL